MNLIWNKNLLFFKNRFPALADMLSSLLDRFNLYAGTAQEQAQLYPFWQILPAKDDSITAVLTKNKIRLHSAYNPKKEADSAVNAASSKLNNAKAAVFLGMGLGYTALAFLEQYANKTIIIIEPSAEYFFAAMLNIDLSALFTAQSVILALSSTPEQAITLVNQYGVNDCVFFENKAFCAHAENYFATITELVQRNRSKEDINAATLEKFRKRWFSNCKKNIKTTFFLPGVNIYKDKASELPFLLLAAGPSLQEILPLLNELKNKVVTVCVDTALRACLSVGFQPDFIVLTDPQYWAYRHIAGLNAPKSILITEAAVYPAVFRFKYKQILCCQSQIPIANFFEHFRAEPGSLGAGGSVASCAWNFCALCGAKTIYVSGLDLAFPKKQTHFKGSTFEQNVHLSSTKTTPAETASMPLLFSGNACTAKDYQGNPVTTDSRMKMFAWWFESRLANFPDIKTYTLSPNGLAIPGIQPTEKNTILDLIDKSEEKEIFLNTSLAAKNLTGTPTEFEKARSEFNKNLKEALNIANKALNQLQKATNQTQIEYSYEQELKQLSIANILTLVPPAKSAKTGISLQIEKFKAIADFCAEYNI